MNNDLTEDAIFEHNVVMININASIEDRSAYHAVRYAWKVNPKTVSQAEYVLAVAHGKIVGVFIADKWKVATLENFPEYPNVAAEGRFGFVGRDAPKEIIDLYMGKRISSDYRKKGASNPIRYNYEYNARKNSIVRKVFSNGERINFRKKST
ncbi:hypothetical protein [Psychrobacter sp. JCM 18900]|uniref:hypothetical protein n=1 Tax=Psychrobacter sp. JCM 18900 TaxID=1298608 RepID=UPI00191862F5|nr:hypothetical protein [Psychrobacter sp. JCM 18900]